ncbi:MAG: [FeFe] hydrogenase H-cluster radical SAM maturase HydG, partial [Eubacteriales bacterium]|nr:[FeFe] hydrogenase H-cluster radical SAM maturase HydG [Eubacteriales bacterium]
MYDPKSKNAVDFINHEEILDTLAYAQEHKNDKEMIDALIERAKDCKGLSHREAALLLECDLPEQNEKMYSLAKQIKEKIYGNRIVMFA